MRAEAQLMITIVNCRLTKRVQGAELAADVVKKGSCNAKMASHKEGRMEATRVVALSSDSRSTISKVSRLRGFRYFLNSIRTSRNVFDPTFRAL